MKDHESVSHEDSSISSTTKVVDDSCDLERTESLKIKHERSNNISPYELLPSIHSLQVRLFEAYDRAQAWEIMFKEERKRTDALEAELRDLKKHATSEAFQTNDFSDCSTICRSQVGCCERKRKAEDTK